MQEALAGHPLWTVTEAYQRAVAIEKVQKWALGRVGSSYSKVDKGLVGEDSGVKRGRQCIGVNWAQPGTNHANPGAHWDADIDAKDPGRAVVRCYSCGEMDHTSTECGRRGVQMARTSNVEPEE